MEFCIKIPGRINVGSIHPSPGFCKNERLANFI